MSELSTLLHQVLPPERVSVRAIDRIARSSDASLYVRIPRAVVMPRNLQEVRGLFAFSRAHAVPMTFRAAGTSLCGQAITDGLLVDVGRHFKRLAVEAGGERVRVEPGVIAAHVNRALRAHGRKMGPDPASIDACMMGGVLANNASGMCCGVAQNAYHTLQSLTFVLPDGTTIDTASDDAHEAFDQGSPELAAGLLALKRDLWSDSPLVDRIRAKYRIKNTTGYSLNALLDFDRPLDIFRHLLIGSEGTLGFIAEAVLATVPDPPHRYTVLLLFDDIVHACGAVEPLNDVGAAALEVMDRASLRSVQDQPGCPSEVRGLGPAGAGLLAEFQAPGAQALSDRVQACERAFRTLPLVTPPLPAQEAASRERLWQIRKGMLPSVGALRPSGTTLMVEDVAFPPERLAQGVQAIRHLLDHHGYEDAIIFGHARDGNLHFVMSQSFGCDEEVRRYDRFMRDLAEVVTRRLDGSLKAEHGTGRNMAPFVETEWGSHALSLMRALKALVDPPHLLNPGVIINDDPDAHVRDLKPCPSVEAEVDRCIECGFCEHVCPSREVTMTPRQRIVLRRWMARTDAPAPALGGFAPDYAYEAVDTCAADGMCATACPVGIDTGLLTKHLRGQAAPRWQHALAGLVARHLAWCEPLIRAGLGVVHAVGRLVGPALVDGARRVLARVLGTRLPRWSAAIPGPAPSLPAAMPPGERTEALYLPSCLTRILGPPTGESRGLAEIMQTVAARAGVVVVIPPQVSSMCCGLPFGSKGFTGAQREVVRRTVARLWKVSDEGRLPVVTDNSSCAHALIHAREHLSPEWHERFDRMTFYDSITFVADVLLPRLAPVRLDEHVVLHPVCSAVRLGLQERMQAIARSCASGVTIPDDAGCCAMGGDRGLLYPELTASATRLEAAQVRRAAGEGFYSSNRTCEIGLEEATGQAYRSLLYLVERATRPPRRP